MLTRLVISVGLILAVFGMFLDWLLIEIQAQFGGYSTVARAGLFDRMGEGLPWFKWCKAGSVLTVIFSVLALLATFFHTSHPHATLVMASFASLCAVLTIVVYVAKMNDSNRDYPFVDPTTGAVFILKNNVYGFGFTVTTISIFVLMAAAIMARPTRQYNPYIQLMQQHAN